MVGADLSGIELRMLGHYISRYSTEFADTLLNGDIHQVNADRVGVSRRAIKTITYAFIYGAGDAKIGHSFDSSLNDSDAKSKGAEIREAFVSAIDGLAELLKAIKKASQKGFIKSIDGRKIALDSPSLVYSAAEAGEYYNLRIPIAAEAKQGKNWSEVH